MRIGNEDTKLWLFIDDMNVYIENQMDYIDKLLEFMFIKIAVTNMLLLMSNSILHVYLRS